MNLDAFYGRKIKRRAGVDPARRAPAEAVVPEVRKRAAPAAPPSRAVRKPRPRA